MISLLPEEWKPGETLFGCPWQAVVITALVGALSFALFFWRTVLAVSVAILLLLFLFKLLLLSYFTYKFVLKHVVCIVSVGLVSLICPRTEQQSGSA